MTRSNETSEDVAMHGPARMFVAIEIPSEAAARVRSAAGALRRVDAPVRWIAGDSMHVTLKFLGDVAVDLVPQLERRLATIRAPALDLRIAELGTFPTHGKPRVVWAGLTGDIASLTELAAQIDAVCGSLGFSPETRAFRPHVTIGRVNGSRDLDALRAAIADASSSVSAELPATEEFTLFRSDLTPDGAKYTPIRRVRFTD